MGDRGNIVVLQPNSGEIYLYSHWGGSDLGDYLKAALSRHWRWDDEQYLARIILNEMQGDARGETGFGISTSLCDNEHDLWVVDCEKQVVYRAAEKTPRKLKGKLIPFQEFIK